MSTNPARANCLHHTIYTTGLVDVEARQVIDMVKGNAAADLRRWTANADSEWLKGIEVVATDLASRSGPGCRRTSITPSESPMRSMLFGSRTLCGRCASGGSERDARPSWPQG